MSNITEPLAFGIGSGLFFIYIPLLKINNGPAFSFRTMPGNIFKRTCKALEIKVERHRFGSTQKAQQYLDECLEKGIPVGCQVGVYFLSYFPKEYRFHFNAHNIVIYGKENGRYLISDPVMETTTSLSEYELERVRFAKGPLAPNGQLYFPSHRGPVSNDLIKNAIVKGIKRNVRDMLFIPGPIAGVSGIKYTAGRIRKWKDKLGIKTAGLYLAQLVRMQEEIGTGGGGFRFIYAAFLQQSIAFTNQQELQKISEQFTQSGDLWRSAAIQSAGIFKGRLTTQADFDGVADTLLKIADIEKNAFESLRKITWN